MGAADISIWSLVYLAGILVPVFVLSGVLKLGIWKEALISLMRMVLQLSFVGLYLQFLFKWDNPLINGAYLLVMVGVAVSSVVKKSGLKYRLMVFPGFIAILVPQIMILFLFIYLTVGLDLVFTAKYMIPIGGMILGNCLTGNIITLSRFYKDIKKEEKQYFYRLALGAGRFQALLPYIRRAMLASVNPALARMATIGLVSLPGMMTGQILGGSVPVTAIKYQIAIMFAIFSGSFLSSLLSVLFSIPFAFDEMGVLRSGDVLRGSDH